MRSTRLFAICLITMGERSEGLEYMFEWKHWMRVTSGCQTNEISECQELGCTDIWITVVLIIVLLLSLYIYMYVCMYVCVSVCVCVSLIILICLFLRSALVIATVFDRNVTCRKAASVSLSLKNIWSRSVYKFGNWLLSVGTNNPSVFH